MNNKGRKRKRNGHLGEKKQQARYEDQSTATDGASTSAAAAVNSNSDIPGFYFDPERRRYFRILPDHLGAGSANVVTPLSMNRRNREIDRKRLLDKPVISGSRKLAVGRSTPAVNNNNTIVSLLGKRQLGLIGDRRFGRAILEQRVRGAAYDGSSGPQTESLLGVPTSRYPCLAPATDGRSVYGFQVAIDDSRSTFARHFVTDDGGGDDGRRRRSLNLDPNSFDYYKVLDMQVVNVQNSDHVFFGALNKSGTDPDYPMSIVVITPASSEQAWAGISAHTISMSFKTLWSCAWNPIRNYVSAGIERSVILTDFEYPERFSRFRLSVKKKDPLVQQFSKDGNCLLIGLRGWNAACCDLRTRCAAYYLPQKCVSSIYVMCSDENYIVASDFSGQIKLWDLRVRKPVRTFDGQVNTHTKLPLVVNEEDSLVIAGGEDGTTRCWSLETGELLREIPSSYEITGPGDIPGVCYSNQWGGVHGNAAIVLGAKEHIEFYDLWGRGKES